MDEWMQHLFQYYNIHSLDVIQMPRPSEFEKAFMEKLRPTSDTNLTPASRMWHFTNTRFILGMRGYLQLLNEQVDPINKPFRVHTAFNMVAKPGVSQPKTFADVTVTLNPTGQLALIENTKALPRAALFTKWQIVTNDDEVLKQLAAADLPLRVGEYMLIRWLCALGLALAFGLLCSAAKPQLTGLTPPGRQA